MRWLKNRQRYGQWKDVQRKWYDGPQGPELLGAHVTEVVESLMRDVAVTGNRIVIESFRVDVTEDYECFTIEATVSTVLRRRNA